MGKEVDISGCLVDALVDCMNFGVYLPIISYIYILSLGIGLSKVISFFLIFSSFILFSLWSNDSNSSSLSFTISNTLFPKQNKLFSYSLQLEFLCMSLL